MFGFYCDDCIYSTNDSLELEKHIQMHKNVTNVESTDSLKSNETNPDVLTID